MVKNWLANVGDAGDLDSIPGSRRSPGGRNGNPLQYSCLENPMDRGAWWATVHGVTKSRTRLSEFHFILQCILVWTVLSSAPKPHMPRGHLRGHRFRSYYFCWAPEMLVR